VKRWRERIFLGRKDQVIGVHGADRALGTWERAEFDGGQGVPGFEGADFGLADSVKFLEGEGAECGHGRRDRQREGVMRLRKSWARAPKSRDHLVPLS
jgi:hypothetical protein